jgi:hypothetical protein
MQEQNMGQGVWVKTHFYRDGHMLRATTYCVVAGNPEILNFAVDLRVVERAIAQYHRKLHKRMKAGAGAHPDPHMAAAEAAPAVSGFFDSVVSVVTAPAKAIGHAAEAVGKVKLIAETTKAVKNVVNKAASLPGISTVVSVTKAVTPLGLVEHLLQGERIDHAALNMVKDRIKAVHDVAPYAQTVLSTMPGLGTGVAAAIAMSAALAEGRPIDDVFIQGMRNAVPGGPYAQALFDTVAAKVKGQPLDKAALTAWRNQVPKALQPGFDVAVAVANGQNIQKAIKGNLPALASSALSSVSVPMPNVSTAAHAAFATAHAAYDAIDRAKTAQKAVEAVKNAAALVQKAEKAVKTVGVTTAKASLAKNPALAEKLKTAVNVAAAGKQVPAAEVKAALAAGETALRKIQEIKQAAETHPDPATRAAAQKSMSILKIVGDQRDHVAAVAQANAGGVPGILIDPQGKLIRGRFARTEGAPDGYLYAKGAGGHGRWSRVSDAPAAKAPPLPAGTTTHAQAAVAHTVQAQAHAAAAKADPKKAPVHTKLAVAHATAAAEHATAAKATTHAPKIQGSIVVGCGGPGNIGCGCA